MNPPHPLIAGLNADPAPHLNPQGHFATIKRIDVDAQCRWLVSGCDDKTVKVWRIEDGALERTLRIPVGDGDIGKVYAVAISPDGARVAAGGLDDATPGPKRHSTA